MLLHFLIGGNQIKTYDKETLIRRQTHKRKDVINISQKVKNTQQNNKLEKTDDRTEREKIN